MVFFTNDPFYNDPFFSDQFYLNPYSNRINQSIQNSIYNTLDKIFTDNNLIDSTDEDKEEKSGNNSTTTTTKKSDQVSKENKNKTTKDMSISDWINNYKVFHPRIDISEGEKNYLIHADLPGMKKEEVKIDLTDDQLTISGERKNEIKESSENKQCYRIERNFGKFKRSFHLPPDIDVSNIQAKMENGVLEISLNKKELPKKETHQILIQ